MSRVLGHLIGWYITVAFGPGWLVIEGVKKWINGDQEKEK